MYIFTSATLFPIVVSLSVMRVLVFFLCWFSSFPHYSLSVSFTRFGQSHSRKSRSGAKSTLSILCVLPYYIIYTFFPSPGFHLIRCGTVLRVGHVQRPIAFHVTKPKTGKQQHICPYAYTCYTVQHSHRSIHAWHTLVDCLLFGVFWLRQSWFGALLWREWEFSNLCLWQKSVRSNNGKSNQITKYEIPKTTWK